MSSQVSTRHFEIFLTMVQSRNMAEAADKLGVSVAAVSKSLKLIERETGLDLFRNVNGRLTPTAEAERLLPFAQRAVDHLQQARQAAAEMRDGSTGRISIGVAGPALISLLPPAVKQFHEEWPRIRIEIEIDSARNLLDKVASNKVDLGVGTPPVRNIDPRTMQLCKSITVCENLLVAVLPRRHALAKRSVVRPADLAGETMIGLPEDSATSQLVAGIFHQAGVPLPGGIVAANAIGVSALVQQGVGVSLLNALALAHGTFPGLVARPFRPRVPLRTSVYHSRLQPPAPPIARLIEALRQAAKTLIAREDS